MELAQQMRVIFAHTTEKIVNMYKMAKVKILSPFLCPCFLFSTKFYPIIEYLISFKGLVFLSFYVLFHVKNKTKTYNGHYS